MLHKRSALFGGAALLLVASVVAIAGAQTKTSTASVHPGLEPHTPSRIEWLALSLQSYYGDASFHIKKHKVTYIYTGPETSTILVHYVTGVDRAEMNKDVESARRIIEIEKRSLDWDWVEVREKYERID